MFVNIMASIVAGGIILIVLLMLLMVFVSIQISNRMDDLIDYTKAMRKLVEEQSSKGTEV